MAPRRALFRPVAWPLLLLLLFAPAASATDATTFTFSRLRLAQDLALTLDVTDGTTSRAIYTAVCTNASAPVDLRTVACDLQLAGAPSIDAGVPPSVVGPAAAAMLATKVELQVEQIRVLDAEASALALQKEMESDAAKMWLQLDKSVDDAATYTATEVSETVDLRQAYGNLMTGLNSNISSAFGKVKGLVSAAKEDIEKRKEQLEADAKKQKTIDEWAAFAHEVIFVAKTVSGFAMGGGEEGGESTLSDAAKEAKEVKESAETFSKYVEMVNGQKEVIDAAGEAGEAVEAFLALAEQAQTQLDALNGVAGLLGAMSALNTSALTSGTPGPMIGVMNQSISAAAIQGSADALIGSLGGQATGKTVAVRAQIDSFAGLVQARASAAQGWWSSDSQLRVLVATRCMLEAQHEHLSKLINDTEVSSERVAHAAALLQAHRRARVSATSSSLQKLLGTVNFMAGTSHFMEPFARMSATNVALGNAADTFVLAPSGPTTGLLPVPGTADLAARHAQYTSMLAQGWTGAAAAKVTPTPTPAAAPTTPSNSTSPNSSSSNSLVDVAATVRAAVRAATAAAVPRTHFLSCWQVLELNSSDLDVSALQTGKPAAVLVQAPAGQQNVSFLAKVDSVRAYTLPLEAVSPTDPNAAHLTSSSQSSADGAAAPATGASTVTGDATGGDKTPRTPTYISMAHLGQSVVVGRDGSNLRFSHSKVSYPFGYHPDTLCPVADGVASGEARSGSSAFGGAGGGGVGGAGDGSSPVKPSLFGLWAVQVGNPSNSRSPITGVRVEFKVSSWVVDGREVECGVPLQLRQLISDDVEPEDPHKALGVGLIVTTALVLMAAMLLSMEYKRRRVQHKQWRSTIDPSLVRDRDGAFEMWMQNASPEAAAASAAEAATSASAAEEKAAAAEAAAAAAASTAGEQKGGEDNDTLPTTNTVAAANNTPKSRFSKFVGLFALITVCGPDSAEGAAIAPFTCPGACGGIASLAPLRMQGLLTMEKGGRQRGPLERGFREREIGSVYIGILAMVDLCCDNGRWAMLQAPSRH